MSECNQGNHEGNIDYFTFIENDHLIAIYAVLYTSITLSSKRS